MRSNKGEFFELELSAKLHEKYPACLISSQLLRSRNCGQIDVAYFSKKQLLLVEAKTSKLMALSFYQMKRLRNSQEFLSKVLDVPVSLRLKRKIRP